ncbi:MAG: hypothetical protein ACJZ2K_02960 [Candidatus Poseidoniaceae archaeon]
MNDNKNAITALVFTCLMLICPLAGAANITTFGSNGSEVTVEVRDGPDYTNSVDGTITLPSGDTVTGASMMISTDMATHETYSSINSETAQYVWDPTYNNQQTEYSTLSDFTYNEDTVQLVSGGLSTDFERTDGSFVDFTQPPVFEATGWEHGQLTDNMVLNEKCNTGNECWGTNIYDFDNDYTTDDEGGTFSYSMITPSMEVDPNSPIAKFSSWHGLHWTQTNPGTNPTNTYYDCGYVMVRNSSSPNFPPPETGWSHIEFDATNSTGISYANGLYPIGIGNGRIQSCDSLTGTDYALGGESTHPTQNPGGWATLALNLNEHVQKYVQLKFVLTHNSGSGAPENTTMPGWFIDDFRMGDPLPQSGSMTVKGFTPKQSPNPGFPDGYGILNLEHETTPTNSLTVTILRGSTTEVVVDVDGNQMTGLEGPIIELWGIDSSEYPVIDLRFDFDTGQYKLSTSVLHGLNIGTRVGTGLNDTNVVLDPMVIDGVWQTPGEGNLLFYTPTIVDNSFDPPLYSTRFSQPIVGVTPVVVDDCLEEPAVELNLRNNSIVNLTVGQKWIPDVPILGFTGLVSYNNSCGMSEIWFDLEFGHNAEGVSLDIAEDGDVEWAMNEPAFGSFGRQSTLWAGFANGMNHGMDKATLTLDTYGEASGGSFMLPMGAEVYLADVIMSNNSAGAFDIKLVSSSGQEFDLGTVENKSLISYDTVYPMLQLKDALNSILTNPLLQPSYIDEYDNNWATFKFEIVNINASSGTEVTISHLDVFYDWETSLTSSHNFDRELNQGIALGTGANVDVPLSLSAGSGGAVQFSDLSITTSTGYDSTLTLPGSPEGLYPNGDIVEAISTHSVDQSTGSTFVEARLRMESSSGVVELAFSELSLFTEAYDPHNLVTMESSTYTEAGDEMQVTWRFRINTAWEDTAELRLYASLIASDGVNGLPGAVVLAPVNGNAIENDAMISTFQLLNDAGVVQNLTSASSNQNIELVGTIRLEGLDISPDPTSYNLSLQRWDVQSINGSVVSEWVEVSNSTGIIGGNFNWEVNLGFTAAGQATYRFMLDGYEGGDTLCPPTPIVSDEDCAIPFNLSIDTFSPSLVNISVLKSSNYDPTIWSNWRGLVDDTWVLPNSQQKVRVLAQDIPAPPSTLDMFYWVEYDHDTDMDGIADPDEYASLVLTSDGNAPTANYSGIFSDDANKGQDPPGKVSIYIEGADLGGNKIEGGLPGFNDDLVTYVSMDAKTPNIRNFFIENSDGERLHNPNEGAPFYQGPWNMTMYAGNEYHLIVEATDENGWRDINYFEIDLGPEDMVVYYSPRNETAWTDSTDIEIVTASNESEGPEVLRMDGGRLVDAFEDEFYLDLPIRMNWDIIGIESTTYVPQLRIKDMDRDPSLMSESGGRHKQRWVYSDGIQLDYRNGISPTFTDVSEPFSQNVEVAFVFPLDTITMEGKYAYVDGINNGVYVLPEGEFTLEVTRLEATMDGSKGYFPYPAGGADGAKTDGPTLHTIDGGAFSINITAPPVTNEYTYTFRLVDLPDGATDTTSSICDGNNAFGCSTFKIKVDGIQPEMDDDSWSAKSGINQDVLGSTMPSSTMHCVDVQAKIEENAALLAGEVNLLWSFYTDADSNLTWPVYGQRFGGAEPQSTPMDLKIQGGDYLVSADCVDLWPDPQDPTQAQINSIDLVMWIEGRDSAGWSIDGGGPNSAGGISSIYSDDPVHNSQYRLVYEEAKFEVIAVAMTPKNPEVGQTPSLEILLQNIGTKDGNITLEIQSVKEGGFPTTEYTWTTEDIEQGTMSEIDVDELEIFASPTSGMYFLIVDAESNDILWNGSKESKSFNVAEQSADEGFLSGSGMLIVVGLGALILILLVAVVILAKRDSGDGTYEYEYEFEEEDKTYAEIPVAGPPTSGPPAAAPSVDPTMAAALAEFPQWDQATIQGYFDQGWDIATLRDWVNENQ